MQWTQHFINITLSLAVVAQGFQVRSLGRRLERWETGRRP
jgi:hypothetical protein